MTVFTTWATVLPIKNLLCHIYKSICWFNLKVSVFSLNDFLLLNSTVAVKAFLFLSDYIFYLISFLNRDGMRENQGLWHCFFNQWKLTTLESPQSLPDLFVEHQIYIFINSSRKNSTWGFCTLQEQLQLTSRTFSRHIYTTGTGTGVQSTFFGFQFFHMITAVKRPVEENNKWMQNWSLI